MNKNISIRIFSTLMLISVIALGNSALARNSEPVKRGNEKQNWAEKLGYPAGKKVIILHADDAGMCEEANVSTKYYLENDYIQSAAVMVPCPAADDFIKWALLNPKEDVGVHLTLTSEWKEYRWPTILATAKVPGLIDPEGKMWHEVPQVVMNASAEEVEKEIRAQIDYVIAMGLQPSHIDTHMGTLYGHPSFIQAFFKVAMEYGIPANAIELSDPEVVKEFREKGYPINEDVIKLAGNYTLPKVDNFTSAPNAKTYEEKVSAFQQLVKSLNPGITEIIFHPSIATENMKSITGSWQQRQWEADMFADKNMIRFFEEEGIIFTNWKEMMVRFNAKSK